MFSFNYIYVCALSGRVDRNSYGRRDRSTETLLTALVAGPSRLRSHRVSGLRSGHRSLDSGRDTARTPVTAERSRAGPRSQVGTVLVARGAES